LLGLYTSEKSDVDILTFFCLDMVTALPRSSRLSDECLVS
jgi:hypothetical protein